MKKTVLKAVAVFVCFLIFSFPVFSVSSAQQPVLSQPSAEKVFEARFINILNHNYVYGEDFKNMEKTVNNAALALLEYSDENSYIAQDIVNGYLFDMYGVMLDDFSDFNKDFPQKDGFLYILPRGLSMYEHEFVSLSQNEDGTFTVITNVTVKSHDAVSEQSLCKTMFVENSESAFGFNIVFSEFVSDAANI